MSFARLFAALFVFIVICIGSFLLIRRESPRSLRIVAGQSPLLSAAKSIQPPQETRTANFPAPNVTRAAEKTERIKHALEKLGRAPLSYDQPGEAAEFYRLKRLPEGESQIPVERYFAAQERMRRMPRYSTRQNRLMPSRAEMKSEPDEAALGEWTPLGPGNIGGRTRALLINPNDPNVMYAAGVAGGVWKSANGGASWAPLSDMLPNIAVSSMAMDPKNPNVIYAGTGEGFFNSDAVRGAGIFKTTDGGANWARLDNTNTPEFYYVNDIIISPINSNRIYAATRGGVMRSFDGGANWERVLNPQLVAGCLDLAIRTDQPSDYIFASCGSFQQSAVYRNVDASGSGGWSEVLKDSGMGRTSIAIAPSNQSVVYAASASVSNGPYLNGLHAIFRSTSGGDAGSWTAQTRNNSANKLNTVLLSNPLGAFLGECGLAPSVFSNQGWYDNVIAVDPGDANRVWVGGIDLFRSDDGGVNWGLASYWWTEKSDPRYAHADHHVITFHPQYNGATNKQMFVGTDGGVFRTDDARAPVATASKAACNLDASGVAWTSLNNGYGVTQFYHGAVFPDGKSYFGGTQDNGTILGGAGGGPNAWREISGGDGGYVAVDYNNSNNIYAEATRLSIRKSIDGGATFGGARFGIDEPASNFSFITPFAMDPNDPQKLWLGGASIWHTKNGAANWEQISQSLAEAPVSALAVAPTNSFLVLAGTMGGAIYRRPVGPRPTEFESWRSSRPRSGFVSSIAFDPTNHNIAYATYSTFGGSHVWRSVDGGATWSASDGAGVTGIPDIPVHCIAVDPTDQARLYIGTDLGVFVSTDGGQNWAAERTGFPNAIVETLVFNTVDGVVSIYAFTHGRGAWRVMVNQSGCTLSLSSPGRSFSAAGALGTLNVTTAPGGCSWGATSNAEWITVTGGGGSVGGTVSYSVAPNRAPQSRAGTITIGSRSFFITQEKYLDTTPPKLIITGPTNTGVFTTNAGSVTVKGVVTDDSGIQFAPSVSNDREIENSSPNTTLAPDGSSWEGGANLYPGANQITVKARDLAGNVGSVSMTVVYKPGYLVNKFAGNGVSGFGGDGGPATSASFSLPRDVAIDRSGNLYITDRGNNRIRKVSPDGIIRTVVGGDTAGFSGDGGPAIAARIYGPNSVAVDDAGSFYFTDIENFRIRKVDTNGIITTVAGNGMQGFSGDGGPAIQARFGYMTELAVDAKRDIYVVDNNRIRKLTAATGVINTIAGTGQIIFGGDGGPAAAASFYGLVDIAIDRSGNIYALEDSRLRKIDTNGVINTIAGTGERGFKGDGGPAIAAQFLSPIGAALDDAGNLYIADYSNGRIRKIDTTGIITSIAGGGVNESFPDGTPATSVIVRAEKVTVDTEGRVYYLDNHYVRRCAQLAADLQAPTISITSPNPASTYGDISGTSADNQAVSQVTWKNDRGEFGQAEGTTSWTIRNLNSHLGQTIYTVTAWDAAGNAGSVTVTIRYQPKPLGTRVAGTGERGTGEENDPSANSRLWKPETVFVDSSGVLYITDTGNHRIRKVGRDGVVTTFAGSGQIGGSGDDGPAINATMNAPSGIALDPAGNVYIADTNNHRVRKVTPAGVISAVAGAGIEGFDGDGGQAVNAQLSTPVGLATDATGNLYIADAGNNRVRKVALTTGFITTVAGSGFGFSGDGGAAVNAQLFFPTGVALDKAGNLFIADTGNHRIRKVSTAGVISSIAGVGTAGLSGDGGAAISAQLNSPGGLTIDIAGNLYFADQLNHVVRRITPDGLINKVAGVGQPGAGLDGFEAEITTLNSPAGVAVDGAGNLFIADTGNHRVLVVAAYRGLANASAASFVASVGSSEMIIAAFGTGLATRTEGATSLPLPVSLAGTSVKARDSLGNERTASLFFVSSTQVNYQIPPGMAFGRATVTITSGAGTISTGSITIAPVAPGLFTATADGQGVAAAVALRIKNDGSQIYEPVVFFDQSQNKFVALPIDLGPDLGSATDQVFLILFGTGIRNRSALSTVVARIGGENSEVSYAGSQGGFVGLDQANLRLPRSLAGRGEVEIVMTVEGKAANPLRINVK